MRCRKASRSAWGLDNQQGGAAKGLAVNPRVFYHDDRAGSIVLSAVRAPEGMSKPEVTSRKCREH